MALSEKKSVDFVGYLNKAIFAFNQGKRDYTEFFRRNENLAKAIYQDPDVEVVTKYYNSLYTFSLARRHPQVRKLSADQPKLLASIDADDTYTYPVRGISLEDINNLPHPLSLENMGRINRFLRLTRFPYLPLMPLGEEAQRAMVIAMILPALDVARPKEAVIPDGLKTLHDNMQAYLDYYLGFMNLTQLTDYQKFQFSHALAYVGINLSQALGLYLPARLGITPSSATKLFLEKTVFGGSKLVRYALRKQMEPNIQHAFRKGNLPAEVQQYQHYNPQADQAATEILGQYYQSEVQSQLAIDPPSDTVESLATRLRRYQKVLRSEVLNSPEQSLVLRADRGPINKIILANQYRSSMMLVVLLGDNGHYLTMDINPDRLYGIPAELFKQIPHVDDFLGRDVLSSVVEFARQQHPNIEPRPVIRLPGQHAYTSPSKREDLSPGIQQTAPKEKKTPVTKRRLSLIASLLQEPRLPEPVQPEEQKPLYRVPHTRMEVAKLMKRDIDSEDVQQVMETLHKFEWGQRVDQRSIADMPDYLAIRKGRWRIVLFEWDAVDGVEPNVFELVSIFRRGDNTNNMYRRAVK